MKIVQVIYRFMHNNTHTKYAMQSMYTNVGSTHRKQSSKGKMPQKHSIFTHLICLLTILLIAAPQLALAQNSSPDNGKDQPIPSADFSIDELIEASNPPDVTVVRTIDTSAFSVPSSDPTAILLLPAPNRFLIADSEIEEIPEFQGANLFYMSIAGSLTLTATTTSFSDEPTGLAYNPANQYLYIADDVDNRIYEMQGPGPDGIYGTNDEPLTSFLTTAIGSSDPEGLEFATIGGIDHLFLVDGTNNTVYIMQPGPNGIFNGGGDDVISSFDSEGIGITSIEGIAYNPANQSLFLAGTPKVRLAEVSLTGQLIRLLDTSNALPEKPSGLDFGPGATPSLYMTDRVIDNVNDGKIYEFQLPAVSTGNQQPVVDAGPTQVVNLPAMSTTMAGTATDDGIPGALLTHKWTVVNSRSISKAVTFVDNDNLVTGVTFPQAGTYVLRLTADDNELASVDLMTVTVNGPPVVDAGINQTVAVTTGATLNGTVTDDDLPVAGVLTTTWSSLSGPGTVTFGDATLVDTTAAFSVAGVYQLNLSADDGGAVISDTVTITATSTTVPNQAPLVTAGPKQTVALTQTVTLSASVSDDGLPAPGTLSATWAMASGPGIATITDATALTTTASFDTPGIYVMEVTVSDGALSGRGTTTVTVASALNNPPIVEAGAADLVALTDGATLNGTVTDDGKPSDQQLTIMWSKISGPGVVTFADASAANTTATFSLPGVYTLSLIANDGEVISEDTVTITVNRAPTVNAGDDQSIGDGETATLDAVVRDDGFPEPAALSATWSKVSGPGDVTFANANAVDTTATFSVAGSYTLQLSVTDGHLTSTDTVKVVIVTGTTINTPPSVSAGIDMTTTLSSPATLAGTVTDDGLPASSVITVTWTKASGPGDVTFANANATDTTVTFSEVGTYILRLTGDDSDLDASDTVSVIVLPAAEQKIYLPVISK